MKVKGRRILMAGLMPFFAGLFGQCNSQANTYEIADIYRNMRKQALELDASKIGIESIDSSGLFGLLMETGYEKAVATLVTIADGSVSLYFSNGGGIIGVGEHEAPRAACKSYLTFSTQYLNSVTLTNEFPLPKKGKTIFYFLTKQGIYFASSNEKDLQQNKSSLSPLYHKAQEVITQSRLVDEKLRGKDKPEPNQESDIFHLIHAATHEDIDELKEYLRDGKNVNLADKTGLTSLMAASGAGKASIVAEILKFKPIMELKDSSGYTALMFACNLGQVQCAKLLIDNKADVNAKDRDNSTPLMFAAQHGNNEIVELLLKKGADPNIKGNHGLNAKGFAKQNSHEETLKILNGKK
jgi:predicted transcriptional regulator